MMKFIKTLFLLSALLAGAAYAQSTMPSSGGSTPAGDAKKEATTPSANLVNGEIRKVDTGTKKITIKHGEIKNLDMPGMTMAFKVKDPAMLNQVKAGDKVRFKVEKTNGALVVTEFQPAS